MVKNFIKKKYAPKRPTEHMHNKALPTRGKPTYLYFLKISKTISIGHVSKDQFCKVIPSSQHFSPSLTKEVSGHMVWSFMHALTEYQNGDKLYLS